MHRSNQSAFMSLEQITLDLLGLAVSLFLSYGVTTLLTPLSHLSNYLWFFAVYSTIWILVMGQQKMYNQTTFNYGDRIARTVITATAFSAVIASASAFYMKDTILSRLLCTVFILTSTIVLLSLRYFYVWYVKKYRHLSRINTIIVGNRETTNKILYYIRKTNMMIHILGFVAIDTESMDGSDDCLGSIDDLQSLLINNIVDEVIFALPKDSINSVDPYVELCEDIGITSRIVFALYNPRIAKVHFSGLGPLPMLTFHTVSLNTYQLLAKRTLDIVGASIGLCITAMIYPFIALAVYMESPGPIVFTQNRVGQNGRLFKLYKFRSMHLDAETRKAELLLQNEMGNGLMFKMKEDPRITRVGAFLRKTSVDEFPQFMNILKGEMSLIGTRPPTVDEVKQYDLHHYRRISIKPGLSGLWQVNGRNSITDFNEVVKLDTQYIDQWSIWLDLKIILQTILIIVTRRGAM